MPVFNVEMINRESGASKVFTVTASDQMKAAEISHREGWVVGTVTEAARTTGGDEVTQAGLPSRVVDMDPYELGRMIRWSVFWGMTMWMIMCGLLGGFIALIVTNFERNW